MNWNKLFKAILGASLYVVMVIGTVAMLNMLPVGLVYSIFGFLAFSTVVAYIYFKILN